MSDSLISRCLAVEHDALREAAQRALALGPDPASLRALSAAAGGLDRADVDLDAAVAHVRWGLESSEADVRWDAVHTAAELSLTPLADAVEALLAHPKTSTAARARAAESLVQLLPEAAARERLEVLRRDDPEFAVRRLATEAQRQLSHGVTSPRRPLARIDELIKTGRATMETSGPRVEEAALAKLGLQLPASWLLFWVETCQGGRIDLGSGSLHLQSPATVIDHAFRGGRDLSHLQEYVWARYVESARKYPTVDEDRALEDYASRYDRGAIDGDAWNYGVLLFESAFRDEARRTDHLLRCRDVLKAYRGLAAEDWDVVDDRLAEAEDLIREEGLSLPSGERPAAGVVLASWDGVVEVSLDVRRPGVFARDPDSRELWRVATSPLLFLNDPHVDRPGDERREDLDPAQESLEQLRQAEAAFVSGQLKQAGRLFGDALEADRSKPVLARATAFLQRQDVTPLLGAQLLSIFPMVGDKKSQAVVRSALQALPAELALAMVEAIAPHNEPNSQIALFVDAAAAIRTKSHAGVRERASQLKSSRGQAHLRTMKNPWYK